MSEHPILIGGCGRSGTTLLLSLLSVHPNIYAIPEETIAFCLEYHAADPPESDAFRLHWLYARLLGAEDLGNAHRWLEKTPSNVHNIGRLIDFFGSGLRFLNIVRDGRDVVTSRHPSRPDEYWLTPRDWVRNVRAGVRMEAHPQVYTVRYEDLVASPWATLRRLCAFLDEPYADAFEDYPATATVQTSSAWHGPAEPVHEASVRRWQQPEHRDVVETLMATPGAVDLLRRYGYLDAESDASNGPPPRPDRPR
jgi:hypothetical protein